jgi:predicted nucleotidyltransferase
VIGVSLTTYSVHDERAVWNGLTLRAWVDVLVERLVVAFAPAKIILFGSVADGTDGPDSDIDLLVVLDVAPRDERRRIMTELRRATRGVAAPHDLVVTSSADLARLGDCPGSTEYEPACNGLTVYERIPA